MTDWKMSQLAPSTCVTVSRKEFRGEDDIVRYFLFYSQGRLWSTVKWKNSFFSLPAVHKSTLTTWKRERETWRSTCTQPMRDSLVRPCLFYVLVASCDLLLLNTWGVRERNVYSTSIMDPIPSRDVQRPWLVHYRFNSILNGDLDKTEKCDDKERRNSTREQKWKRPFHHLTSFSFSTYDAPKKTICIRLQVHFFPFPFVRCSSRQKKKTWPSTRKNDEE